LLSFIYLEYVRHQAASLGLRRLASRGEIAHGSWF
jgi:hypothetical protein